MMNWRENEREREMTIVVNTLCIMSNIAGHHVINNVEQVRACQSLSECVLCMKHLILHIFIVIDFIIMA